MAEYYSKIFSGIDLKGKTILDIGCGSGKAMEYAQNQYAIATGIDPNYHGNNGLNIQKIKFQDYKTEDKYDIILLHDSINHLNEKACITLWYSTPSMYKYMKIFNSIDKLLVRHGKIIVVDASPVNFFANFNIKNPFDSTIQWYKHQPPELWANILLYCGFRNPQITWIAPRNLPQIVFGSELVSYFMVSHFRIVMEI